MVRAKFIPGLVVAVPIDEGLWCGAHLLSIDPYVSFHDYWSDNPEVDSAKVVATPLLFTVAVDWAGGIKEGGWQPRAVISIPDGEHPIPRTFVQDANRPENMFIVDPMGQMTPASFEEIQHLERAAAWNWMHVVQRLADHRAGRDSDLMRHMRPRRP